MILDPAGNLYCAGDFTSVNGITANRVAMWNGTTWTALGDGLNNRVHALALLDGNLYAGGQFTEAGGERAINIAMWNGSEWSPLGIGPNGTVYALAAVGDELYAGGQFTITGGIATNNLARWDGENWNAVGNGTNGRINALTSNGSSLVAGGNFTLANGVTLNRIGQWNGTEWTALGTGVDGQVFALTTSNGNIYAGGEFSQAGGLSSGRRIARWNGSAWSGLGTGIGATVYAIAANDEDIFAGNTAGIIQWNGSAWSQLGSGTNGLVRTLTNNGLNLYVGGDFTTAGGKDSTYAAESITAFEANISVSYPQDTRLANASTLELGDIAIGSEARYVFVVRNLGNVSLTIDHINLTGGDDELFTLDTNTGVIIEDATTFAVSFAPTAAGIESTTLEVESNDPDTPIFTLEIEGNGADAEDMFFASMEEAGLEDFDTLPEEIPFNDGVENVLKYGFNMDLTGPDASLMVEGGLSGLPRFELIEETGIFFFRFEFLRRKGSGLAYATLKSPDLEGPFTVFRGRETVEDIDLLWERVFIDELVDLSTEPKCFGRVRVELPFEREP
ncbi:choice-of-anchor D domain-containing protein [Haloferula sp.]|uniref:choice-of-anchor D domain-containing protein n=1 Tax=Haloferula sp. TaxID=2497595 RepID=UPI003C7427A5